MIEVQNLTVKYGQKVALDNFSLRVKKGDSILLAGANGSGKTTLLRTISGILRQNGGEVLVDGESTGAKTRIKTGYIPASVSLYDGLKLKDAIKLHASFYPAFDYKPIGGCLLETSRRVGSLSKGEKTIFFLSLALATSPDYLLVDDVIHFLDPHLRDIFLREILKLIEMEEMALIIAAQSSFDIEGVLEKVVVMDKGQCILEDSVEGLKRKFVKLFVDEIPENIPVVFTRDWEGTKEIYIYPYSKDLPLEEKVEFLRLPEILRACIGGEYDHH